MKVFSYSVDKLIDGLQKITPVFGSELTKKERLYQKVVTSEEPPSEQVVSTDELIDMIKDIDKYASVFAGRTLVQEVLGRIDGLKNRGGKRRLL